jgi:predicted DNA-binding transcriptional regulator AlpA
MTHRTRTDTSHLDRPPEVPKVADDLLTITEVAAIVRVPVATLRYWRHLGTGPRSFRVGRGVRYWRTEVTTWLQRQSENGGPYPT